MRSVIVKTSYEGVHCWPQAPQEVAYLANPHRHIFHIEAEIEVFHNDRELEFIMIKHKIDRCIGWHLDNNGVWQMGAMSCEQVAEEVLGMLQEEYGTDRRMCVSVFEDNENGCRVWS